MHMHLHMPGFAMKTERVTLLTTPEFKRHLVAEAQRNGVSVAELVRSRFGEGQATADAEVAALAAELRRAVADARRSLSAGLAQAEAALAELRAAGSGARSRAPAGGTRRRAA
jgi:transposase-like protein